MVMKQAMVPGMFVFLFHLNGTEWSVHAVELHVLVDYSKYYDTMITDYILFHFFMIIYLCYE